MREKLNLRRWRSIPPLARHAIVLMSLAVLLAGGALGGGAFGAFARGSCAGGDRVYRVNFGDTLSAIAARYSTSWQRLATYNHLANPNLIFPYQTICIPTSSYRSGGGGQFHGSYVALARQDALNAGISPDAFVRQINLESGFNPRAISPAGAIGIAQFMPATAASLGVNPYDPVSSLWGAARLMASYVRTYGNLAMALAAYNAGPGAVTYAVRRGGGNWRAFLPWETQRYINIILG